MHQAAMHGHMPAIHSPAHSWASGGAVNVAHAVGTCIPPARPPWWPTNHRPPPALLLSFCLQVNATVAEAQFIADQNFTTTDSTVWDRLPSVTQPVLLLDGSLVGAYTGGWRGNNIK